MVMFISTSLDVINGKDIVIVEPYSNTLCRLGFQAGSKLLSMERCQPNDFIRKKLKLDQNDEVVVQTSIMTDNNRHALFIKDYTNSHRLKEDPLTSNRGGNIFDFLESLSGEPVEYMLSDVLAVNANQEVADHLNLMEGTALILLRSLFLDPTQKLPLALGEAFHHPDIIK